MATRKGTDKLQFFDPNEGLLEFDNSLEFSNYLPSYNRTTYPARLSKEAEVTKFQGWRSRSIGARLPSADYT